MVVAETSPLDVFFVTVVVVVFPSAVSEVVVLDSLSDICEGEAGSFISLPTEYPVTPVEKKLDWLPAATRAPAIPPLGASAGVWIRGVVVVVETDDEVVRAPVPWSTRLMSELPCDFRYIVPRWMSERLLREGVPGFEEPEAAAADADADADEADAADAATVAADAWFFKSVSYDESWQTRSPLSVKTGLVTAYARCPGDEYCQVPWRVERSSLSAAWKSMLCGRFAEWIRPTSKWHSPQQTGSEKTGFVAPTISTLRPAPVLLTRMVADQVALEVLLHSLLASFPRTLSVDSPVRTMSRHPGR